VLRAKVSVFVELWTKTQQLHAHSEAARLKEAELRAVGAAIDEANAQLKAALAADGELGRDQVEKAMAVLSKARARL
jgi:hypothetical protein